MISGEIDDLHYYFPDISNYFEVCSGNTANNRSFPLPN